MKLESTLLLKIAIFLIGLPVLAVLLFLIPQIFLEFAKNQSLLDYLFYGIFLLMFLSSLPFFYALRQALKLLSYIDKNKAFTTQSVKAINKIKQCALIITSVYIVGTPLFYVAAEKDDAPGLILMVAFVAFTSFVVATLASLFQKLFQNAIDIKSENDLTV